MRKEQRDVTDLGGFGIIREAFKLLRIHPKTFLLILLIFIVPVVKLIAALLYFELSLVLDMIHSSTVSGQDFSEWMRTGSGVSEFVSVHVSLVLVWIPLVSVLVVVQIAQGLSLSTIFYAVGLIYTGKTVSFRDVVRAAIPRLWWRVTVTCLYIALINYTLIALLAVVFFLLITFNVNYFLVMLFYLLVVWTIAVTGIHLTKISIGAAGVSVFEEEYGWAAFPKCYQLMKGKEWVISRFSQLSSLPNIVVILLIWFFYYQSILSAIADDDSTSTWSRGKLLLGLIIWSVWMSIYTLFYQLGISIIYVSCKATHNERIEDSYLFDDRPKSDGYEAIEDPEP